jgi:hypothetical protein
MAGYTQQRGGFGSRISGEALNDVIAAQQRAIGQLEAWQQVVRVGLNHLFVRDGDDLHPVNHVTPEDFEPGTPAANLVAELYAEDDASRIPLKARRSGAIFALWDAEQELEQLNKVRKSIEAALMESPTIVEAA